MLCFELIVDGNMVARASDPHWVVLAAHITAARRLSSSGIDAFEELRLHLGGLTNDDEQGGNDHLRWRVPTIKIGSEILIRIVESDTVDRPSVRFPSAHPQPEALTYTDEEWRKMRYEDYLDLKAEFDPD